MEFLTACMIFVFASFIFQKLFKTQEKYEQKLQEEKEQKEAIKNIEKYLKIIAENSKNK